ncbi:hypothetical protein Ga0609869_001650 [Rhodovulum iodosum]|uniref:Glycosyltransferase RgtA/B/C/D-like domain-containing protein n=1 Tax=Rhodovulum iodosum TaxID=68291 RepID=A0ABV3XSJ8_9RHOB|nr:glycosyltransferase family 39 protein [Rhodovulum robiginosum]RSK30618.1 hypothetical protein EJA01_17790 [Rhodovulum robiginosum]
MTEDTPRVPRRGWLATLMFLLAITAYFAAQTGLRVALGGALETDEAEMMVMTPGLRLGYGPQLPLYNWVQWGVFELFGRSLFALSLVKNGLLWLSYLFVFLGLRLWVPAGAAVFGALALFFVPDIAWEAERATTHSNMLLATSGLTLAAFLWALRGGALAAWLLLGLAMGLGGLAKYNYWLVPAGLALSALTVVQMRAQLVRWRALLAPLVALAMLAAPYNWMVQNPDLAFASLHKLQLNEAPAGVSPEGLTLMAQGAGLLLALPLIVAGLLFWLGRRKPVPVPRPGVAALLVRAALILALLVGAGVYTADIGHITPRWLLPVAFLFVPGLFVWLHRRIGPRAVGRSYLAVALLAVLVMGGLTYDRFKPGARRDVDFTPLPGALAEVAPLPDVPVVAEFYTAGNLKRLEPDWSVSPYLPFVAPGLGGQTALFLLRDDVPSSLEVGMRLAGWPAGAGPEVRDEGVIRLPSARSQETLPIRWLLVETPVPDGLE